MMSLEDDRYEYLSHSSPTTAAALFFLFPANALPLQSALRSPSHNLNRHPNSSLLLFKNETLIKLTNLLFMWFFPGSQRFVGVKAQLSAWDEKPYEILPGGKISYLDEEDVVSFLDPPKELIPLDPASYNPAAYLWLVLMNLVLRTLSSELYLVI